MQVFVDLESGHYEQFDIFTIALSVILGAVLIALGLHFFLLNPLMYLQTIGGIMYALQGAMSGTAFVVPPLLHVAELIANIATIGIGAHILTTVTKIHTDHHGAEYIGLWPSKDVL